MQHGIQGHDHVIAGEGFLPGGHFIEHHAEGKQVGAGIELFAARLLRRHVNRGAGNHAHRGQRVFDRSLLAGRQLLVAQELGQAEVENLGLSRWVMKMLAGLMSRWMMPLACEATSASAT